MSSNNTQVQTNSRNVTTAQELREFLNPENTNINNQAVSILGNSLWGVPFIPQPFRSFKKNFNEITFKNTLEANLGTFKENHLNYQGNILPYLTAYSVIQNNGQINFTRLAGINLPNFPNLKPGFSLNNDYKLYLITLKIKINNEVNQNFFNYDNLINTSQEYYQCLILTKKCQITSINKLSNEENQFILQLTHDNNDFFESNNTINLVEHFKQKMIFDVNKPSDKIRFCFNTDFEELYWKNVLNTNIHRINDFGYALIDYVDIFNKINYVSSNIDIEEIIVNELQNNIFKNFNNEAQCSNTPWIVSQGFYNKNQISDRKNNGFNLSDRVLKLFKIHSKCPGELGNSFIIKIIPISLKNKLNEYASFNLHLIDKKSENLIYAFNNLNLDINSQNFIGRVIGTEYHSFDINLKKIVRNNTDFLSQNPWIRVELSDDVINQKIPYNTIPCGYFGKEYILKNNLINNKTYQVLSDKYVINPQFKLDTNNSLDEKLELLNTHAWGYNFKNILYQKLLNTKKIFISHSNNDKFINRDDLNRLNLIKHKNINLNLDREIEKKLRLNDNFYEINLQNDTSLFHLEKIMLLNLYNAENDTKSQYWNYSKYIQSGENINTLKNDINFYSDMFDNNTSLDNLYYYFTVNNEGFINNKIDSVEEANEFNENINILSFNIEMTGGWDGLNLLDINEYSINDKGLSQSQYLRELYKIGLEIINDEVNGQNELIYLPEIFNSDIVSYASDLFYNSNSLLLLDKPFYSLNNNIIYSRDLLQLDNQYSWYDQKYVVLDNDNIELLQYDFDITLSKWQTELNQQLSNNLYFGNYCKCNLPANPINGVINQYIRHDHCFIIPAGMFALNSLVVNDIKNLKMNPLHNISLNGLGEIKLINNIEISINENNPILILNKDKINNLNINLICQSIRNAQNTYGFYSDKTGIFTQRNNSIFAKINIKNTFNDIKKKIRLISYSLLFQNITAKENVINNIKLVYNSILSQYLRNGLIANYLVKLDEKNVTDEDLSIGLIRGSIYIQFNNQEEIIQLPL